MAIQFIIKKRVRFNEDALPDQQEEPEATQQEDDESTQQEEPEGTQQEDALPDHKRRRRWNIVDGIKKIFNLKTPYRHHEFNLFYYGNFALSSQKTQPGVVHFYFCTLPYVINWQNVININKFKITSTDPTLDESIKVGFHENLYTDGISTCIAVSLMTRLEDGTFIRALAHIQCTDDYPFTLGPSPDNFTKIFLDQLKKTKKSILNIYVHIIGGRFNKVGIIDESDLPSSSLAALFKTVAGQVKQTLEKSLPKKYHSIIKYTRFYDPPGIFSHNTGKFTYIDIRTDQNGHIAVELGN